MPDDPKYFGAPLAYLKPFAKKGKLIVVEGTDVAGRSTQVALLKQWLEIQGYSVVETGWARSELMHGPIEKAKNGNFMDRMTFTLFYATDFADRFENLIIPALKSGHVVLSDRYMYTALVRDAVRDPDQSWVRNLYSFALIPDLVIHMKIDMDTLISRVLESGGMNYWEAGMDLHMGRDLYDSFVNYQSTLIDQYDRLAKEYDFETVDACKSVDEIQTAIRDKVKAVLDKPRKFRDESKK